MQAGRGIASDGSRRQSVSGSQIGFHNVGQQVSKTHRKYSKTMGYVNGQEVGSSNLIDQNLKDKLSYDWKQIYRKLNANDVDNSGRVTVRDFKNALHQTNTFISKEDLDKIETLYGRRDFKLPKQSVNEKSSVVPTQSNSLWSNKQDMVEIDYDMLSQNLLGSADLHHKKFNAMRQTHSRLNQIKKVFKNE